MPFCRQLDLAMFNFRDRLSPFSTSSAIISCNKHLHWAFPKVGIFLIDTPACSFTEHPQDQMA